MKVELQADCLSGVWVNREEKKRPGFLEAGDIDAALTTATAIGDDTLQRQATGTGGARFLHPRLGGAAQAMVHDRLPAGHGAGLQTFGGAVRSTIVILRAREAANSEGWGPRSQPSRFADARSRACPE